MASINLDISQRLDITCRKNDTFSLDLDIKNSSGSAIDLTSYTFTMQVKDSTSVGASVIIASSNVSFTADALGNLNVKITGANMNVAAGDYVYDIQATSGSGGTELIRTWIYGFFKVNQDITS